MILSAVPSIALALALTLAHAPAPARPQEAVVPFDTPQIQLPVDSPPFQRLGDFDGDGDLDAVGTRPRSSATNVVNGFQLVAWENRGDGWFTEIHREFPTFADRWGQSGVLPLEVGDWSGDGLADFVVGVGTELYQYRSTPDGSTPFERTTVALDRAVWDLVVADFDGDGPADVALLMGEPPRYTGQQGVSEVEMLWSGRPRVRGADPGGVRLEWRPTLLALESDGDGLPDLAVFETPKVSLIELHGRTLRRGTELRLTGFGALLTAGDIDRDGDEDLVSFSGPERQVEVLRRTGARSWRLEPRYAGGPAEYLADIDGDGDLDGVCCSGGGGTVTLPSLRFLSTFEIALNHAGVFAPAFPMPGLGSRSMAGAADVDGDGDVDLVAGRCVYFQTAPWGSLTRPEFGIRSELELVDVDGDGDDEPWRTSGSGLASLSYRNQGDGRFDWQAMQLEEPGAGLAASGLRLPGDFDGDGDVDLIQGVGPAAPPGASTSHLGLWRNRSGGDFVYGGPCLLPDATAPHPLPFGPVTNFLLADLQQDGDLDLVFVPGRYRSQTYLNDGTGSFVRDTVLVDPREGASAFADLDRDGRLDKLVYDGSSIIIQRRGLPAGSATLFGEPEPLFQGVSGPPGAYALADCNQDGDLDLARMLQDGLHLWLNRLGTGQAFLETLPFGPVVQSEARSHLLDVDRDGRMDLLYGPTDTWARPYRYHRQKSDAPWALGADAYEPAVELVLPGVERLTSFGGTNTETVLLASDLDGDGDPDLAGEYSARNRTFEGASAGARRQYGTATAGTAGLAPTLGAVGPFVPGQTIEFRLTGASATRAWLGFSLAASEHVAHGVRVWIDTSSAAGFGARLLALSGADPGSARATLFLPLALGLVGRTVHAQALAADPGGPAGWSATRGLALTIGTRR